MLIMTVMRHRQRAIVRAFERAGATAVATACSAEQLGLKQGMAWHQLMAAAVLRCPASGRYFLDLANWQRLRRRRRLILLAVAAGLLALLVLLFVVRPGR